MAALKKDEKGLNIMCGAYTHLLQSRPPPRGPGEALSDAEKFKVVCLPISHRMLVPTYF